MNKLQRAACIVSMLDRTAHMQTSLVLSFVLFSRPTSYLFPLACSSARQK